MASDVLFTQNIYMAIFSYLSTKKHMFCEPIRSTLASIMSSHMFFVVVFFFFEEEEEEEIRKILIVYPIFRTMVLCPRVFHHSDCSVVDIFWSFVILSPFQDF